MQPAHDRDVPAPQTLDHDTHPQSFADSARDLSRLWRRLLPEGHISHLRSVPCAVLERALRVLCLQGLHVRENHGKVIQKLGVSCTECAEGIHNSGKLRNRARDSLGGKQFQPACKTNTRSFGLAS